MKMKIMKIKTFQDFGLELEKHWTNLLDSE